MHIRAVQGAKYRWHVPAVEDETVLSIASTFQLSYPIARVLAARGLTEERHIRDFLFTTFDEVMARMSLMKDAKKAVERIQQAIEQKEKILIFGDYDVDGITSSAMMMQCLKLLHADVNFYLPHRVRDGYGLSTSIVQKAAQSGYKVIITVDNGITAFEPAELAKKLGIDLIITDHHRPHDHVPDAYAVVNPNQEDCQYPFKYFAGVGVSFKVLSYLYYTLSKELPSKVYELLLLGTVADVVPLVGENRFWVRQGLLHVNRYESLAFKKLKQNSKVTKPELRSLDIGFSIAPQLNALGRLDDPRDGVKFLIGSDEHEVERIGNVLFELNQARKDIERSIVLEIEQLVASGAINPQEENIIIAASESWPPGVIGLVASRIVSAYGKPTILLHLTKNGLAKGSCRSIAAFNMFEALQSCADLLEQFGGHAQAAGLSLKVEHVALLKERLEARIKETLTPADLEQVLSIDAHASMTDIHKKMVEDLQHLEPFGHQNGVPLFYIENVVQVQQPQLLKDLHVKCHIFADGIVKPLIFFNRPELYEQFVLHGDKPFHVAVHVTENHWQGNVSIELQGVDVSFKEGNFV